MKEKIDIIGKNQTLYVFDFDNTISKTADTIRRHGYDYDFSNLDFYPAVVEKIEGLLQKNENIFVLSRRRGKDRPLIEDFLIKQLGKSPPVILVRHHALKWFWIHWWAIRYRFVLFWDDMMKGEENNRPQHLFFPPLVFRNIRIKRGFQLIDWRQRSSV